MLLVRRKFIRSSEQGEIGRGRRERDEKGVKEIITLSLKGKRITDNTCRAQTVASCSFICILHYICSVCSLYNTPVSRRISIDLGSGSLEDFHGKWYNPFQVFRLLSPRKDKQSHSQHAAERNKKSDKKTDSKPSAPMPDASRLDANSLHARVAQFGDRQVPSSRTYGRRRPCLEAFPIRKDDEDNILLMDSGSDRVGFRFRV